MQIATKKDIPDTLTVEIEKLSNLGFGIAKYNGYVIFIPNSCPGDTVKIKMGKKNKHFGNANIIEIIKPSEFRIEPFCKMQKICGACQIQYIDYEAQLRFKKEIVEDTMHSIYRDSVKVRDVIPSPDIKEYRHKIQYPIGETKDSKRILAGYYKQGSHELVNIKYCPIQPAYCDNIIEFIREKAKEYNVSGYDEKTHKGELRHVVIRTSSYNKNSLVVFVVNNDKLSKEIKNLASAVFSEFNCVTGIAVNYNTQKSNLILGDNVEIIEGNDFIEEKVCNKIFKVGAKTFFQVNPKTADNIFRYVKDYISSNFKHPSVLDAYAGITAFGICLADIAGKIVSVEEVKESVDLANDIIKENKIENIELHCQDASKFFAHESMLGRMFDVTVLDPPRKGCSIESLDYALKLTRSKIIYVSCNPATLARDLRYLADKGAKVEFIQPFDMFPHTYHIENVAIIDLSEI